MWWARRYASASAEAAHQPTKALHQKKPCAKINKILPCKDGLHNEIQALCKQGQLDRALETLSLLPIPPSPVIYSSLLKACSRSKALPQAEYILQHIARHNIELPSLIGDYLVVTLAKCGNVDVASHIFVSLPFRTAFSWTAIISALIDCGHAHKVLDIYHFMHVDAVEADNFTYASLFRACGAVKDLESGRKLHTEACKRGFSFDAFVNNTLVSMYGKCGAILETENVFCKLAHHDVISWNAMLSTYLDSGQGKKALLLYRQMQDEGVNSDKHTVVFTLQACEICTSGKEACAQQGQKNEWMCLEIGAALHADARIKGFASEVFVGTALLCMYGRCGAMLEAEGVFCILSEHDVVAWNALLSIYNERVRGAESLQLFIYMQKKQDIVPDQLTRMLSFQACGIFAEKEDPTLVEGRLIRKQSLEIGKALHDDAARQSFASGDFVGNTLLNMYVKCGVVEEAENIFRLLSPRDTVSWSVMISAYIEQEQAEKSLQIYRQMQNEGVSPDHCVFMSAARACGALANSEQGLSFERSSMKAACLEIGQALHADVYKGAFAMNAFLNTTFLSMYSKCGAIEKVEDVIGSMSQLDTVSWNALLSAYVEHGQGEKVLRGYGQMLRDCLNPDQLTFVCALQACGILAEKDDVFNMHESPAKTVCLEIGQALHADASKFGFSVDALIGTALLTMYGKCGSVEHAEEAFWALSDRDIVAWNGMLSVLADYGQDQKALCLYQVMQRQGAMVNDVTFVCLLNACSDAGNLEVCNQLHFSIIAAGLECISSVSSTLVHAYGNCGCVVDSQKVFEDLSKPDFVSWTACLASFASEGNFYACACVLENLKLEGVKRDEVMLTSLMSACSHAGHVNDGLEFYAFMKESGLGQSLKHYGIMAELLGRAGDFKRLENFLEMMEVKADLILWMCLLGSCHTHHNVELAKQTFNHVLKLQSTLAMPYVLMANIYAGDLCTIEYG